MQSGRQRERATERGRGAGWKNKKKKKTRWWMRDRWRQQIGEREKDEEKSDKSSAGKMLNERKKSERHCEAPGKES